MLGLGTGCPVLCILHTLYMIIIIIYKCVIYRALDTLLKHLQIVAELNISLPYEVNKEAAESGKFAHRVSFRAHNDELNKHVL